MDLARSPTGLDRQRLWELAARTGDEGPGVAFSDVGLFLEDPTAPDRHGGYDDSPAGSVVIASTGGDGVHFSALLPDGRGSAPIVMTAPMAFDRPNTVVGADLREFLALGCTSCFCHLDELAYDWGRDRAVRRTQSARAEGASEDPALVDALAREFDLRPWPDVAARLAELEREHGPRVRPAYR